MTEYMENLMEYTVSDHELMLLLNQSMKMALEEQDPDRSIQRLIEFWGRELDSDRTYIFEQIDNTFSNTYEWCREGIRPEIDGLQGIPSEVGAIWIKEFERAGYAIVKNVEDIKESDPLLYEVLKPQELTSVITCPIYYQGQLLGLYGVDNPPADKMDMIAEALPIIGNFLDSLIIRRNLMKELAIQSLHDSLTEIPNKRAMDLMIAQRDEDQFCAVIFCDICGLKQINDTRGHSSGDIVIKKTADNLTSVFGRQSVFRVGGDEFVVIVFGESEKAIQDRIKKLCILADKTASPIAIGYVWSEKSDQIPDMIQAADEKMYEDKKRYYTQRTVDRRRR